MALYASILRPIRTPFFHNQFVVQIVKHEARSFKLFNYKKRHFVSSTGRKKSDWKLRGINDTKAIGSENELRLAEGTAFRIQALVKPFLFTFAFSSGTIAVTAIWQYENVRSKAENLIKRKLQLREKPNLHVKKQFSWRNEINKYWSHLGEGDKVFVPICFLNVLIFMAWRIPKFQPAMIKYFCSTPFSTAICWPMVLCTFSHYNIVHLVTNMYVLHTFSNRGVGMLGKEQFLGLYLAGGVISSFFSYLYKMALFKQSLSMGASGAIMAILAYICAKDPDAKLALVFLPSFVFSAATGIKCLLGIDLLGAILRWKYFDHAAHLGGAISGLSWCFWGNTYIWKKREPLLQWWHDIRSAPK